MKVNSYSLATIVTLFLIIGNTVYAQPGTGTAESTDTDGKECKQWNTDCNTTSPIWRSGRVGIGNAGSAAYKLSVTGGGDSGDGGIYATGNFAIHGVAGSSSGGLGGAAIRGEGGAHGRGGWFSGYIAGDFDGNVDIDGTLDVTKVKVNEILYSKEIIVKLPPFPDYVFEKTYELMPLKKLEAYIAANKRLPNMPSAEEVEKDGGNVGELQVKQMEKIEELTLYILEMNKRLEKLEAENAKLKEQTEGRLKK